MLLWKQSSKCVCLYVSQLCCNTNMLCEYITSWNVPEIKLYKWLTENCSISRYAQYNSEGLWDLGAEAWTLLFTRCLRHGESVAVDTHIRGRANCKRIVVFDQNNALLEYQRWAGAALPGLDSGLRGWWRNYSPTRNVSVPNDDAVSLEVGVNYWFLLC